MKTFYASTPVWLLFVAKILSGLVCKNVLKFFGEFKDQHIAETAIFNHGEREREREFYD
jgi:hypothetical protein